MKATRQFEIYAPLQEFHWDGSDLELAPGFWIRRFEQAPDLHGMDAWLADDEKNNAFLAGHWLTFQWNEGTIPSPIDAVNLVLLSLWLVKPTRSHVGFCFRIGQEASSGEQGRWRLHDRFAWVSGAEQLEFETSELQSASSHYAVLRALYCARGRLNDALILTITGCWSYHWQSSLICHAAAAEAILTYATGAGITRRLSASYACLVETEKHKRDTAFREFQLLYSARSDVMHGRVGNIPSADRLPTLVRFQNMLRTLWRTVLSSSTLISVLEGTDVQRETHFLSLQSGYVAPL